MAFHYITDLLKIGFSSTLPGLWKPFLSSSVSTSHGAHIRSFSLRCYLSDVIDYDKITIKGLMAVLWLLIMIGPRYRNYWASWDATNIFYLLTDPLVIRTVRWSVNGGPTLYCRLAMQCAVRSARTLLHIDWVFMQTIHHYAPPKLLKIWAMA